MPTPSHAQVRSIIDSLCDLWDRSVDDDYVARKEVDRARAVSIHTTAHHAVKMARALRLIDQHFDGIESAPIARSILESAITAGWLLLTPDSGDLIIREGAQSRKAAIDELIAQGMDPGPGYAQALETIDAYDEMGLKGGSHVKARSQALAGGGELYSVYRALSGRSHAGIGVMDFYVVQHDSAPAGILFNPHAVDDAKEATLGMGAIALVLTLWADELARAKPHRSTQLQRAAKKLGFTLVFERPDGSTLAPR